MAARGSNEGILPASISLGRIAGIPIGLHFSWFLIAALITLSLAAQFRAVQPDWDTATVWSISLLTAVLFFVSLVLHELAHAMVARARGIPVRSITLFALGGIAQITRDATSAAAEFQIAVVGPIVSVLIGIVGIAAAQSLGWSAMGASETVAGAILGWLGSINVVLAVFNLLPAYPLDGGRILRAALWGLYRDGERATRESARVSQVIAGALIVIGVIQFFMGAGFGGLWLAFIGWFLLLAAQAAYVQAALPRLLRGVRVADIMADDCSTVDAGTSLRVVVDEVILRSGRRCVIVQGNSRVLGLVTPSEVRAVDRSRWTELTVRDVMRPIEQLRTVTPDMDAAEALIAMARADVNQLPVVAEGHLRGMVSRGQILRLLQARSELGA